VRAKNSPHQVAGRTYLAIDQNNTGAFADADDLLLDITGATGTIATSNFI
jgi:hypothetical protein